MFFFFVCHRSPLTQYTLSRDAIKIVASPSYTLHTVQYTVCYKTTGLGTQDASPLQVYRLHLPKQERYNVQWCIPCCIYHSRNLSNLETNRTKETAGWCYEFSLKRLIQSFTRISPTVMAQNLNFKQNVRSICDAQLVLYRSCHVNSPFVIHTVRSGNGPQK